MSFFAWYFLSLNRCPLVRPPMFSTLKNWLPGALPVMILYTIIMSPLLRLYVRLGRSSFSSLLIWQVSQRCHQSCGSSLDLFNFLLVYLVRRAPSSVAVLYNRTHHYLIQESHVSFIQEVESSLDESQYSISFLHCACILYMELHLIINNDTQILFCFCFFVPSFHSVYSCISRSLVPGGEPYTC